MTPEQKDLLAQKRWQNVAALNRSKRVAPLASALNVSMGDIAFLSCEETQIIKNMFFEQLESHGEIEVPTRADAVRAISHLLERKTGECYLLGIDYEISGVVPLNFMTIRSCVSDLLQSQGDCLRLVAKDGSAGVCVITQEGADNMPYYLTLWT